MRYLPMLLMLAAALVCAQPYDETADAERDIQSALRASRDSGKFVLLEFGANWCRDCLVLAEQMRESPLRELIGENFIDVKIDIGEGDKNQDLVRRYGNVTERGIPSIVVLDPDNNILLGTLNGQLASARSMGKQELYDFFVTVVSRAKSARD
jgi:thiol:disulfide interchange protein